MKLRFYQLFWIFTSLMIIVTSMFVVGFEYTIESDMGDYLIVGRPRYFEYTSTNDGVSWEVLFNKGDISVERWEDTTQTFLFETRY